MRAKREYSLIIWWCNAFVAVILTVFLWMPAWASASIGWVYVNKSLVKKYTDTSSNEYSIYATPSITVIRAKRFSFHFVPTWVRLQDFMWQKLCKATLNGTYFWFNPDGTYFPAGIWYEYGNFLREPYIWGADINLAVLLSSDGTTIKAYDNATFQFSHILKQTSWPSWYGNAGPRLVRDWKINRDIVTHSSHWQRKTTRAGIITNPDGTTLFVIATQPISLPQFIAFSYSVKLWIWKFQFINIDGGASTALKTPYNSYYAKKRLPTFICIQ